MAFDRKVGVMDLATVLNISERRVGQLCRDGILAKDEFGTYDLPTNVQAYVKFREGVVAEASGSSVYGRARASLSTSAPSWPGSSARPPRARPCRPPRR